MAKCEITGKGAHFGNNVSHSHRRSNHMWKANIRKVRVKMLNGSVKTMHVSARALRSGLVERA